MRMSTSAIPPGWSTPSPPHASRTTCVLFPDERHMPRKLEDRVFMEEQIRDYFLQNL